MANGTLLQPLLETLAQLRQRLAHPFLHGFDRDLECAGNFAVLETVIAAKLKHFANFFRQSIDGGAHCLLELGAKHLVFGRGRVL